MMPINAYPAKSMEDRPMKVNLGKLTEGIGTVFTGVLQMLESIDVKSAEKLLSSMKKKRLKKKKKGKRRKNSVRANLKRKQALLQLQAATVL